jgi:hypothetical protein
VAWRLFHQEIRLNEDTTSPFSSDPEDVVLRAQYVAEARRFVPPDFDVEAFWFDLLGSFDASFLGKLNIIQLMTRGGIPPDELLAMREELNDSVERWNDLLGVEASKAARAKVRRMRVADPRDPAVMAALPTGDPDEDAAALLYAFVRVAGVEEVSSEERLDLLRRAAFCVPVLPDVQRCLAKMITVMALEAPSPERQEELLREALMWVTRAQQQAPEDPQIGEAAGYILEELAALCGDDEATELLAQAAESYAIALRGAGECADPEAVAQQATLGLALANWQLGVNAGDREQERSQLAKSLAEMQRAVEKADPEDRNQILFFVGAIALDLAWAEDDTEARRRAFEAARDSFALAEPESGAQGYQAVALLGLAALSRGDERRRLAEQAAGYLAVAVAPGDADADGAGGLDRKAARAWLYLAAESAGVERLEAAECAVTAARRGLEREPGKGRYNLACALSLAGQVEAAAGELAAAIELEPGAAQEALADADLVPLFAARPDLRAALERRVA